MADFLFLVPIALGLGVIGLASFLWALRSGQYEDIDGAAERILLDEPDRPIVMNEPKPISADKFK
jgi:cbb3-type cytochrome oxidase maturation protein